MKTRLLTDHQIATIAMMRAEQLDWIASSTEEKWKSGQAWYIDTRVKASAALRRAVKQGNQEATSGAA